LKKAKTKRKNDPESAFFFFPSWVSAIFVSNAFVRCNKKKKFQSVLRKHRERKREDKEERK